MFRITDNLDALFRSAALVLLMGAVLVSLMGAAGAWDAMTVPTSAAPAAVLVALAVVLGTTLWALSSRRDPAVSRTGTRPMDHRSAAFEQSEPGRRTGLRNSAVRHAGTGFPRLYRGETEQPRG